MMRRFHLLPVPAHALRRLLGHGILGSLAILSAGAPLPASAQYSESKMGEYLHYAYAAANGGVYAGIDGIGYTGVGFGMPSLYQTNTGWVDLPITQGFNSARQIYGSTTAISHDGSVVAGSVTGTTTNGVLKQVAAYWVNGVESVVPAPPDDPGAITVSATAVSGDGTTLLVQDGTVDTARVETFVYHIASGSFTSLGFLGNTNDQTFGTAINSNGTAALCFNEVGRLISSANPALATVTGGATCTVPTTGTPPAQVFNITLTGADRPLEVKVALGGQVHMCDPNVVLSANYPEGC